MGRRASQRFLIVACALAILRASPGVPIIGFDLAGLPTTEPTIYARVDAESRISAARALESQGHFAEAFKALIVIPGGAPWAARIAHKRADQFLPVVRNLLTDPAFGGQASLRCVEADLLIVGGDKAAALEACRKAAAVLAASDGYVVELPEARPGYFGDGCDQALPFDVGPGSQRDNALLRRLIALKSWDDGAIEFSRVWSIHRRVTGDAQYGSRSLEFILDYANFLKDRNRRDEGLAIISEALLKMDMDPVLPAMGPKSAVGYFRGGDAGLSRTTFVRLAYGEMQSAGRQDALIAALQQQIDRGRNAARRVLAQIRLHQSRPEDAFALETAYIQNGRFDELSSAYRRGMIDERYQKLTQASAEFEKLLALPYSSPNLPAEENSDDCLVGIGPFETQDFFPRTAPADIRAHEIKILRSAVLRRLNRLYMGTGRNDKVLDTDLELLEMDTSVLAVHPELIDQEKQKFAVAHQQERFAGWLRRCIAAEKEPLARASLCWGLDDLDGVIGALVECVSGKNRAEGDSYAVDSWKQRFVKTSSEAHLKLLRALVAANPNDGASRMELLALEPRTDDLARIVILERILDSPAAQARQRGGEDIFNARAGLMDPKRFQGVYDAAYRLMRLYERVGQFDKLQLLALRIAKGDKPFDGDIQPNFGGNGDAEFGNACLALAVAHADGGNSRDTLAGALANGRWPASAAQLTRRMMANWPPAPAKPIGWANLPPGVSMLVSGETCLSMARDDRRVYVGQPWGVTIYDFDGRPINRVALGEAALHMVVLNGALWVGTPVGLNRVDLKSFAVSFLPCDQDLPEPQRNDPERKNLNGGVAGLATRGNELWIGTRRNPRVLDTVKNELRVFPSSEIGVDDQHRDWAPVLIDGSFIYFSQDDLCFRYDISADLWQRVDGTGDHQNVQLIGLIEGRLWGNVYLGDPQGYRACTIDRKTLAVTLIPIDFGHSRDRQDVRSAIRFIGKQDGKLLFSAEVYSGESRRCFFDEASGRLRIIETTVSPEDPNAAGLRGFHPFTKYLQSDGTIAFAPEPAGRRPGANLQEPLLELPNGAIVVSLADGETPRYCYDEDWPFGPFGRERHLPFGGTFFCFTDGRRIDAAAHAASDSIAGDSVFAAAGGEGGRIWLATDRGVGLLDAAGRVLCNLDRDDGLLCNRITGVASLNGKTYFAARFDDDGGGLLAFDPVNRVFTAQFESDGLACNALRALSVTGRALSIDYDVQYQRWGNYKFQQYAPMTFDPLTGAFSPRTDFQIVEEGKARSYRPIKERERVPLLGGSEISRQTIGRSEFYCGTRGVLISAGDLPVLPRIPELSIKRVMGLRARQLTEAKRIAFDAQISPAELEKIRQGDNPYLLANALVACSSPMDAGVAGYLPAFAACVRHPLLQVRSTAVIALSKVKSPAALDALGPAIDDSDFQVRCVAACSLMEHDRPVPLKLFEEIFDRESRRVSQGNMPYGADSSAGIVADADRARLALSLHADKISIALFLKDPIPPDDYEPRKKVFESLGIAMRSHPDALEVLLKAHGMATYCSREKFVQAVCKGGGKELLPEMHKALASDDRVVRSNAARACGAIADPSSIPFLDKAWDLESGLSRASIVWAWGQLKDRDALPRLTAAYIEMRTARGSAPGPGVMAAQNANAVIVGQYTAIQTDSPSPENQEELLSAQGILEAIAAIGPQYGPDFYRQLASDTDPHARIAAAVGLAAPGPSARDKNQLVLRALASDSTVEVAASADVSLLILGDTSARAPILTWLSSRDLGVIDHLLADLERVPADRLRFAGSALRHCADDPALSDRCRESAERLAAGG